jgi:RNA polymerase sigma-70 factor (ECF subfamily)
LNAHKTEEKAFRALMAEHAPYLWRVLRALGVSDTDLADVCQETFLLVHRKLPTFEGRSSLRTWICGIALNVASDYRSKAYRRREVAEDALPEQVDQARPLAEIERREAWRLVDRLLEVMPEEQRRVFVLYEIEQLPMKEVAAIVDCPLSTAYSRLHAARETVRENLAMQQKKEAAP